MCPHCRQNAPLVYRGVTATCTACGRPRLPLTSSSVTLAGQPSKLGGAVARGFGWATLGGGWSLAAVVGFVAWAVSGFSPAFWILTSFFAITSSVVAWALLRGGRELVKSGTDSEVATKNQAIYALASTRGGTLVAWDVAQALDVTVQEADDLLTKLAKEQLDQVKVDVDDEGRVLYRFSAATWANLPRGVRVEVPPPRARVEPAPEPSATAGEPILREEDLDPYGIARPKARGATR